MSFAWFGGLDGVTLTVEAALSAATGTYGAWDAGRWDTATWGPEMVFVDISAYVRSLDSTRKFSRDVQAWQQGTGQVVLSNRDARFSPANLSGPYVTAGVTQIRPWRPIRWTATYAGTTYYLYAGYAMAWEETLVPGHVDGYVTVPCLDEYARLAGFDGLAGPSVGAGESTGLRFHRVLNNANHTGPRAVDVGRMTCQATTLASNAATELTLTTDSEGGGMFVDADGTVVFEQEYALMENARSNTVQATFGDGSGSELPCFDVSVAYNGDLVKNIAAFARVGGTQQTVSDQTSRALYGDLRDSRTDLVCETDAQALNLATFWLEKYKAPELRVTQIVLKPRSDKRLWPHVLGRRLRDLVRVVVRPIGGITVTRDCHIAGISHQISGDDWVTTFDLASATVFQTYANSRWDLATATWDGAANWFFG